MNHKRGAKFWLVTFVTPDAGPTATDTMRFDHKREAMRFYLRLIKANTTCRVEEIFVVCQWGLDTGKSDIV